MKIVLISIMFVMLASGVCRATAPEDIVVEVTGGKSASFDRIVERELNLEAAGKLLGKTAKADPQFLRVVELGAAGENLATMLSQVDATDKPGNYTVCWKAAGELGAGQTRKFKIVLDGSGSVPVPAQPVNAVTDGTITTVTNGNTVLTYSKGNGGLFTGVTVNGITGSFGWADKAFDGSIVYYLAHHAASKVRLLSSGPLRVVYETEAPYLLDSAPDSRASNPKAVYRFTHNAGEPVAYLSAEFTQDYGKQWQSLHFAEIHFGNPPITHYSTDQGSGKFDQSGGSIGATKWAALHGENLLLGIFDSTGVGGYNGGGKYYDAYIKSGVAPTNALSYRWKCGLYFGSGPKDIPDLDKWSAAVSDTPTLKVTLGVLDKRITKLTALAEQQRDKLSRLDGQEWASAYIRTYIAGNKLRETSAAADRGAFDIAASALAETQAVLEDRAGDIRILEQGEVLSGLASGYPFLVNKKAAYFWSIPEQGAGLISIYDRRNNREFLSVAPASATLWQATIKKGAGGKAYASAGTVCKVDPEKCGLKFSWGGPFGVRAEAHLAADESLLRLRLTAVPETVDEGILNVTFPVVSGIVPITAGSAGDVVLDTRSIGDLVPSPLASGHPVQINYPWGMQFTALQGANAGLYFADEDPDANQKNLIWSKDNLTGNALAFFIIRPVLGWGGAELVKKYTSPGDVVIGPFSGDWYDATQLYRKWAITAPWAAKGPIHARSDVPNWLKNATYWTVGNMGGVTGINHEMEKHEFLGSGGIFHAYGYYHNLGDKIYPEVFPPKIGSEGFKNTVDEFHKKGIRVVTYINGSCWDETTESYQKLSEDQKKRGRTDTYGGGVWLAGMSPCEKLWQDKLAEVCSHGVAKYGIDGWYIDFLTNHTGDCFKTDHGHPIAGGNHWTKSVRDIYGRLRREIKALNPDGMLTAEANVEWVIDLLDTQLVLSEVQAKAPLYQAVYHDYGMIFGGSVNNSSPCVQGRWWLMGNQNGWHNVEGAYAVPPTDFYRTEAKYYLRLLRCHREFGLPYLGYGRMLRMPRITTAMPVVTHDGPGRNSGQPVYTVPAVEGSAWQAADGTVGIFFLNYSGEPQEFTWTMDLGEAAGWGAGDKLRLSQWMEEGGLQAAQEINGGKLNRSVKMEGRGILALKLEVIR